MIIIVVFTWQWGWLSASLHDSPAYVDVFTTHAITALSEYVCWCFTLAITCMYGTYYVIAAAWAECRQKERHQS
jgi:ABC-type dipeptide/oligopeptide/nickel transport system permease component